MCCTSMRGHQGYSEASSAGGIHAVEHVCPEGYTHHQVERVAHPHHIPSQRREQEKGVY